MLGDVRASENTQGYFWILLIFMPLTKSSLNTESTVCKSMLIKCWRCLYPNWPADKPYRPRISDEVTWFQRFYPTNRGKQLQYENDMSILFPVALPRGVLPQRFRCPAKSCLDTAFSVLGSLLNIWRYLKSQLSDMQGSRSCTRGNAFISVIYLPGEMAERASVSAASFNCFLPSVAVEKAFMDI